MRNRKIISLAGLIGRSVGAVSYKLANFARLDPEQQARGIRGMTHGAKGEVEIWKEFQEDPDSVAYESETLLAERQGIKVDKTISADELETIPKGMERDQLVRVRVNQSFFRSSVLAAYRNRCCVTGLTIKELLVASHIVPWAVDAANRTNPKNGLCLNALHDKAFDRGLMTIDSDFRVRFATRLIDLADADDFGTKWMLGFEGTCLSMPDRFTPDPFLLAKHTEIFRPTP